MARKRSNPKGKGLGGMIERVPWWVWVGGLAVIWTMRAKMFSSSVYPAAGAVPPKVK